MIIIASSSNEEEEGNAKDDDFNVGLHAACALNYMLKKRRRS